MTDILSRDVAAPVAPAGTGPWIDEIDDVLTCVQITDITHDVKSFTFALPQDARLQFLPGQYLTFALPLDQGRTERCYTIASAPTRPQAPTITVKRVPGGPVSNWLHDRLRIGDQLRASGPYGQFSTACHPAAKYAFLSAGSGITPLMSMARTLYDSAAATDLIFVHCARTPDDIIFRQELETISRRTDISVAVICEDDSATERWYGARGRLSLPLLRGIVGDLADREVFSCGPPPFMESVRSLLETDGPDPARRHQESFLLGAAIGGIDTPGDTEAGTDSYRVEFRRSGRVIECDASTTLLDSAQQAGLVLPSSCGEGICGTCKSVLLSGRVEMQHQGGIRPREVAQDKILLCCSTPTDDLVIDA